jgi:Phage-related protein
MADSVGQIGLDLVVNQNGFNKQLQGITSMAKKAGVVLAAAFSVKKLVDFSSQCIKLGSDLNEIQNVVTTTFPNMSNQVDNFARNAISKFGLSETVAKKYIGTMGAMSQAFGMSEKSSYDMATAVAGLAGDVSSFYNISSDEAMTKLKSIWTGETESLKDLGVVMTQSALDQFALQKGFGKTTAKMSEQEKLALRYQFVMDRLSLASGDFQRTSGGWANQTRVLSLRFQQLQASIGQGLIFALTPVIKVLNILMAKLQTTADLFSKVMGIAFGKTKSAAGGTQKAVAGIANETTNAVGGVGKAAKAASKAIKEVNNQGGIDELNIISKDSSGGAGGAVDVGGAGTGADTSVVPNAKDDEKKIDGITKKINGLKKAIAGVGDYVSSKLSAPIGEALSYITPQISAWKTTLFGMFSDIGKLWDPLLNYFTTSIIPGMQTVIPIVGQILGGILDSGNMVFSDLWNIQFAWINKMLEVGLPLLTDIGVDMFKVFNSLFTYVKTIFDTLWSGAIAPGLNFAAKIMMDLLDSLKLFWDNWGDKITSGVMACFDAVTEQFRTLWTSYLGPIVENMLNTLTWLWDKHLKGLVDQVLDVAGKLAVAAMSIYTGFIAPIVKWLTQVFGPIFATVFNTIVNVLGTVIGTVADVTKGIFKALGGIIDFITGVFTGNWKKAWEGVKDIFGGIFDGIVGIFKGVINLVIDGINLLIKGLNSIKIKLPDWLPGDLGGKKFGIDIPEIPKLAQGGYVKANTPQLAMIGDNTHEGEVVSPESKLMDMAQRAASMASQGNMSIELLQVIIKLLGDIYMAITGLKLEASIAGRDLKILVDNETNRTGFAFSN